MQPARDELLRLGSELKDEELLERTGLGALRNRLKEMKIAQAVGVAQQLHEGESADLGLDRDGEVPED